MTSLFRSIGLAIGLILAFAANAVASIDAAGNVTSRAVLGWQTLSWDSYNRLIGVSVAPNSGEGLGGYSWTTVYDGFGRRVQTTWQPTTTAGANDGSASTITYYYDPQVKYLELGQMVLNPNNSSTPDRTWKVYGPDKSGTYGGDQGIGGLDNEVDEAGGFANAPFNNYFGDAVGEVFVSNVNSSGYTIT